MKTYTQQTIEKELSKTSGWKFNDNAIEKKFKFKDFREAIGFMVRVSFICESKNHHPEWTNVYNKLTIRFSTHDADGVTEKDIEMAVEIDKITI